MDNVTHSLAGLLLAEGAVRLRAHHDRAEPSARFRAIAAVSSVVAANLPDADLLYTGIGADRLTYMLQHRGYTHTVVAVLVGAVLVWGVALLVWRWRARMPPEREDARWLFGLLLVSTLSHLLLDWTNSYGVHPFWPFDNRWIYGDAVFIVEPWLWVVSVPALVAASGRRVTRVLLSLVLLGGLALAWRVSFVSTGAVTALTVGAALSVVAARVLRPGARAVTAIVSWVAVTLVMAAGASKARATALRAAHEADAAAEVLDVVVSPLPANPVCTTVITVERAGASYRVATARVSAAPSITDASRCGARDGGATFFPSTRASTSAIRWDAEWTAPGAELAMLARESCQALAALRFIRVPTWRALRDSMVLLGDVRYGGSGNGFADVRVPRRSATCPQAVPPWTPPRSDLLTMNR
jgi:inner membrane protein